MSVEKSLIKSPRMNDLSYKEFNDPEITAKIRIRNGFQDANGGAKNDAM